MLAYLDFPKEWQCYFQDPATPVMEAIINFHDDLFFILIMIVIFVGYMLARAIMLFEEYKHPVPETTVHGTAIEVVWTITPALILITIAIPSFSLLYSMDESIDPVMTVKCVGHQWYWSYEYSDFVDESGEDFGFDSYMIPESDLKLGNLRLLETDKRVVLPTNTHIRLITTSADVLHSWAVPSFGIKLDACPGRLNETNVFIKRPGTFYGQCSEICGINHGFMPIVVVGLPPKQFSNWIEVVRELKLAY